MSKKSIEWSAIVTSYNSVDLIYGAIQSAFLQSLPPTEIIVVDDCSSDGSFEYLLRLSKINPLIRVYSTEINSGGAAIPRNRAIDLMKTPIGIIFDDDDTSSKERAACHLEELSKGAAISYVGSIIVDPDSNSSEVAASNFMVRKEDLAAMSRQLLLGLRLKDEPRVIVPSSVSAFVKKSVVDVGGFDPKVLRREDIDLAIRIVESGMFLTGTEAIHVERLVTTGTDKSRLWDVECERNVFELHRRILPNRLRFAGKCLYEIRKLQASSKFLLLLPYAILLAIAEPRMFKASFQRWMTRR